MFEIEKIFANSKIEGIFMSLLYNVRSKLKQKDQHWRKVLTIEKLECKTWQQIFYVFFSIS